MTTTGLPPTDLGPCCACGRTGPTVRNLLMLPFTAPVPGTGWGCLVCGLPTNGALAVLCDPCLAVDREPVVAINGYPAHQQRIPISALSGHHHHDRSKHVDDDEDDDQEDSQWL